MHRKARGAYHHGDLRASLIDATLAAVKRHGPEGVTLRTVAGRAGVSEAAPYHHFRNKTELLAAAAAVGFRTLDGYLERAGRGVHDGPEARLAAMAGGYVRFAVENRGAFRLIFGAHVREIARDPEARAAGRAARERILEPVREILRARREPADEIAAHRLLGLVWAQCHGTAWLAVEDELRPAPTDDEAAAMASEGVRRLLNGPRATPRRSEPIQG